jgi:predicted nucleic acid-binding protein
VTPSVVLDASAFLRAGIERAEAAREWLVKVERAEVEAFGPDVFYVEVANSLLNYVRSGRLEPTDAEAMAVYAIELPITVVSGRLLAPALLETAVRTGLSAYDAAYLLVCELEGALLVSADKELAAATEDSVLIE